MDKQAVAKGPFAALIADGVRVEDTIYLSGAVSIDAEGTPQHANDFLAQNRVAYRNIENTLKEFGATMDDVVKETVFIVDMGDAIGDPEAPFQTYGAMRHEIYGGRGAEVAQSLIQVAGLVMPELRVEIEVEARL
jgi:enamine deaminase RidA (YjgF/YER057c/UK114 family)